MTDDVKSADALLPCPFCGSKMIEDTMRTGAIICLDCGSSCRRWQDWNRRAPAPQGEAQPVAGAPWGWWLRDLTTDKPGFMVTNPERLKIAQPSEEWEVTPLYAHPSPAPKAGPMAGEVIDARTVAEAVANCEGVGNWMSCTGCHELDEGHPTGRYSMALKCYLGLGCTECGGLGAVWDTTDYAAMGDWLAKELVDDVDREIAQAAPAPEAELGATDKGGAYSDGPGTGYNVRDADHHHGEGSVIPNMGYAPEAGDLISRALVAHHKWHQSIGIVTFPAEDGQDEPVTLDMSAEYADSGLCDMTIAALSGANSAPALDDHARIALGQALEYLRGDAAGQTSGGHRNGDLRNRIKWVLLGCGGPLRALPAPVSGEVQG